MKPNSRLVLIYTLVAGVISAITAPIPGTSLLLTALEVFMIVHLAKVNNFQLGLKEIGYSAAAIWGISTVLKDVALEILTATFGCVNVFLLYLRRVSDKLTGISHIPLPSFGFNLTCYAR